MERGEVWGYLGEMVGDLGTGEGPMDRDKGRMMDLTQIGGEDLSQQKE